MDTNKREGAGPAGTGAQENKSAPAAFRILLSRWKDGTFGEILDDWRWIFGYSRRYLKAIIFYVLSGILSTTLGLVSAVMTKYMIDIITGYQYTKLWFVVVTLIVSSGVSLLMNSLVNRISVRISLKIENDIRSDIFDRLIDTDWLSISRYRSGDILSRFNADVRTVSSNAVSWVPTILVSLYRFAATFFLLLYYDGIMALIAFLGAPVLIIISRLVIRRQREYGLKLRKTDAKMMAFETETFSNLDTIKSFGIMERSGRRMREHQEEYKDAYLEYNLFSIKTNAAMSVTGLVVALTAFGYCLYRLWTHDITYGTMTLFMQQRTALSSAFDRLVKVVPAFLNSSVSAHRIRELVELPKEEHLGGMADAAAAEEKFGAGSGAAAEMVDGQNAQAGQSAGSSNGLVPVSGGYTVQMRGVTFAYDEGEPVITDSDLIASPGEIIALVGPSGEGKTTIIRLLLGLVRPGKGSVIIRSADGREMQANADLRTLFAYVPQGNTLLSGTIADNLRMVREEVSDEELEAALKAACAWDFVSRMPDGMYSEVGERGHGLSEGQAQRIAIARAIVRNAPILLLDEATSALDVETERRVLRSIITEHPDRTVIVTTHRPTVLGLCRRVCRVVDTKVVELSEEEAARLIKDF